MPVAELDGLVVGYDVRGEGPRTVVFSHGFLMDRTMFEPQVDVLASDYRCITWDERGHGETRADGPFTFWDSARDVLGLLDHLEVDDAALVGMSQGGFLSLRAALTAPDRVRGLAFLDSQAGEEDAAARPAYDALFDEWVRAGVSGDVAQVVGSIILGDADDAPWVAKWKAWPADQIRHIYGALMDREGVQDRLSEITCPALVVHGTADTAIPMDEAEALCAGLAGCRGVVRVEGGGHAVNLTHPAPVTDALRSFLGTLWPV